jgi:hypothetical protein
LAGFAAGAGAGADWAGRVVPPPLLGAVFVRGWLAGAL